MPRGIGGDAPAQTSPAPSGYDGCVPGADGR